MAREQIAILNRVARKSFTDIFEQTLKKKTSTMQLSGERILDRGMLSAKVSWSLCSAVSNEEEKRPEGEQQAR